MTVEVKTIELKVMEFHAEYYDCGSHRIKLEISVCDYEIPELIESFEKQVKSI